MHNTFGIGNTPLHIAAIHKNIDLIQVLFAYDAYDNFKMENIHGQTALDIIKQDEDLKKRVIQLLTDDDGGDQDNG